MSAAQAIGLDVTWAPPRGRRSRIFRTFDGLPPGAMILLATNYDPKPLHDAFAAERVGTFEWRYLEDGPEVWRVEIRKAA